MSNVNVTRPRVQSELANEARTVMGDSGLEGKYSAGFGLEPGVPTVGALCLCNPN